MNDGRPSWDEYFMAIAHLVKKRATCPRKSVGAVLVRDKQLVSSGYNGAPRGHKHCIEIGCELVNNHCMRVVHAEQNVIAQAATQGHSTEGSTMYVTTYPCNICLKMAINAGVKELVYDEDYPDPVVVNILKEANVKFRKFEGKRI